MSTFKNEFSWSISRDRVFQTCPRQYYFNYYAYWGGWETGAPARTRQIYILKNLQNHYMWTGTKVHDCIKHTLTNLQRGIAVLDVDQIIDITLNQMREEFRSSRDKHYLTHPKTCALLEHEYDVVITDAECKKLLIIWSSVYEISMAQTPLSCLSNFFATCGWRWRTFHRLIWMEHRSGPC